MRKKRIIASITIKDNLVVQSISYSNFLPLGKLRYFIKNLDRWNVDEILIRDIGANKNNAPNFFVIDEIKNTKCSTPIIYGGGITNLNDAKILFNSGVDRIMIENLFFNNPQECLKIINSIGSQSVILSLSMMGMKIINYKDKSEILNIDYSLLFKASEVLINDVINDGVRNGFDIKILNKFKNLVPNLICYGGISSINLAKKILKKNNVSAISIGNFLNFSEHYYQNFKKKLKLNNLRNPYYEK